ncbi:MAG TPA: PEGA domain-containing protein [Thermodesulfobacteriaceae bacterium]|nr:PEGA domain-containing protein [Thermodesulfobacteriaceae bacterium]
MKKIILFIAFLSLAASCLAQPIRVALTDFTDETGMMPDEKLGGTIKPGSIAAKGLFFLSADLVGNDRFVLIDRREFITQMERLRLRDGAEPVHGSLLQYQSRSTPVRPTFLSAARVLRADAVLRGSLISCSTKKEIISQGGYRSDFSRLTLRVTLEALDAVDGSVIAMTEGAADRKFRQTASMQTILGEDDLLQLLKQAIGNAVKDLEKALIMRAEQQRNRARVRLWIASDADPAMVEIDGILVGSTPIEGLEVYRGDHIVTVGKPGYQDVTKRIMLEKDTRITVPMIRVKLDADQLKEVVEKMRVHLFVGEPAMVIHTIED